MKNKITGDLVNILITIITSIIVLIFYYSGLNLVSSILLFGLSIYLFCRLKSKYGYYTNSIGLFSFIWFFTIGLATLRLHQYQVEWKFETWGCLIFAYLFFYLGHLIKINKKEYKKEEEIISKKRFLFYLTTIFLGCFCFFILEVILNNGMIPLFSDDMASYQKFAVGLLHYLTVTCCFVPPVSYLFLKLYKTNVWEKIYLIIINILSLLIPIFIVSRQLIIVTFVLSAFTIISYNLKKEKIILILTAILIFIGWIFIGNFRNQDDEYLKKALKIQDDCVLSVGNMQAYMYVSMNFDNFNANVGEFKDYQYGLNSVYPIFGLTRVKSFLPSEWFVTGSKLNRIIDVYNTYPVVMTPYLDGGIIFVCIYMFIIGLLSSYVENLSKSSTFNRLLEVIIKCCLTFSFFSAWLSKQNWWFYIIYLFVISKIILKNYQLPKESEK